MAMRLGHSFAIYLAPLWLSPLVVPDPEFNLNTSIRTSCLRPGPRSPFHPITALLSHCHEYLSRRLPSPSFIYTYAHLLHHLLKSRCASAISRLPSLFAPLLRGARRCSQWPPIPIPIPLPNFHFRPPSIPIPPLPRWLASLAPRLGLTRPRPRPLYAKYASPADEQKYWAAAARGQRALAPSDARAHPSSAIPLVLSYVPRLLPLYRARADAHAHAEYALPPTAFCKWHRMVYPGKKHPSLKRAAALLKRYSSRDRREMHRIARLLPDAAVFSASFRWTPVYREMWARWLDTKGPDIAIVFE